MSLRVRFFARNSLKPVFYVKPVLYVVSNAIQAIDNATAYLIIYCLNCIRRDENLTFKTDLTALSGIMSIAFF